MLIKRCPKCKGAEYSKDGKNNGKQRYKCKSCNYRYTVSIKSTAATPSQKRLALQMYLEGMGFRSIGRILNFSNVSVLRWIRSFGEQLKSIKKQSSCPKEIEMDEIHTYVQKKMQNGYGYLLIELGKKSEISLLAIETPRQERNYGKYKPGTDACTDKA